MPYAVQASDLIQGPSPLTPDPLTTAAELDENPRLLCWNGFLENREAHFENFYEKVAISLDSAFISRGDYSVYTVGFTLTHTLHIRIQRVSQWRREEVLPYKPDMIAGDLNNLATRAMDKRRDVHPRNGP